MTATVYNGAVRGTGSNNVQALYTNSTGGNVRVLWNYMEVGSAGNSTSQKLFYGPTPPTSGSLGQAQGNYLNVLEIALPQYMTVGKELAIYQGSQNFHYKMTGATGFFPMEMMIANTHKISLWTNNQIQSDDVALMYNFVIIPE
tara:strand:- start:146 stop:577 length:432 start_codon:yes stop_codon:yes gene_type:complete